MSEDYPNQELACSYAALILNDGDVPISADKVVIFML